MLDHLPALLFLGLLLIAAMSDIASMKIPNWISIALTCLYPVSALAFGSTLGEIGLHLAIGMGTLVLGFVLFQFRIFGGGDAKLLAAAAVWTGISALLPFAYWTAIAGGGIAALLLAARAYAIPHPYLPAFCNRLLQQGGGMPYGVAIFIGSVAAAPHLPIIATALTLP
jgi:prepilin peptidase CpaA